MHTAYISIIVEVSPAGAQAYGRLF